MAGLGLLMVCGRGNITDFNPFEPHAPAATSSGIDPLWYGCPEEYVISVGASDTLGTIYTTVSSIGEQMDFLAPGIGNLVSTTAALNDSIYSTFGSTSAAAPHVIGLASLIMGMNFISVALFESPVIFAPEDVERIIERTCDDLSGTYSYGLINETYGAGYDEITGWGRVNAGEAINAIDPTEFRIRHFTADIENTILNLIGEEEVLYNVQYDQMYVP